MVAHFRHLDLVVVEVVGGRFPGALVEEVEHHQRVAAEVEVVLLKDLEVEVRVGPL